MSEFGGQKVRLSLELGVEKEKVRVRNREICAKNWKKDEESEKMWKSERNLSRKLWKNERNLSSLLVVTLGSAIKKEKGELEIFELR